MFRQLFSQVIRTYHTSYRVELKKYIPSLLQVSNFSVTLITNTDDKLKEKTPFGRFSDVEKDTQKKENEEKEIDGPDPFAKFPDATNPETGEVGGPTGPEPTRYGDWERKGRVTDF